MDRLKLKEQLENDIDDLLQQVRDERELRYKEEIKGEYIYRNFVESEGTKNYSDYRKLIITLKDTIDTYFKYLQGNGISLDKTYINNVSNILLSEINIEHVLMKNSLERKNNDQYRCLNSVYLLLLNIIEFIQRINPATNNISHGFKDVRLLISSEEKNKCKNCEKYLNVDSINFYKDFHDSNKFIPICKKCVKEHVSKGQVYLLDFLQTYDIPYINKIWLQSVGNISEYFSTLHFKQYRGLRWADSKFI